LSLLRRLHRGQPRRRRLRGAATSSASSTPAVPSSSPPAAPSSSPPVLADCRTGLAHRLTRD
jgi:hypothetical protein